MIGGTYESTTEKSTMNTRGILTLCLCAALSSPIHAQENSHGDHEDEESGGAIKLTIEEREKANIEVDTVAPRVLNETVRLPAEVVINAYKSASVTPRITAQVVERHVQLGDHVEAGQPLVTLSSVEMAEAQGGFIVADLEWQRVKSLGRQTVSERRYTEAQVSQQQALGKVQAYGMTEEQANALTKSGDASKATGAFDLLAPQSGTVLQDSFIVGELIEPGRVLVEITDEAVMWVEARTAPGTLPEVERGAKARISLDGISWLEGTVIQRHHRVDETTRTQGLRIEVENVDDNLHPGQFVEVEIVTGTRDPVLAVPREAVTMIDGAPSVFKLEDGHEFHAESVDAGATVGEWIVIQGGLIEGDEIAISGVFYLKSLLLKSSLGEGHGH
jgi:cobalt-zinc-cadmium efflux system membrane fusion protein